MYAIRSYYGAQSGFADILATLDENPLPVVLLVLPAGTHTGPEAASELRKRFSLLPETDLVQLDLQWVQRLTAILDTARRGVLIISAVITSYSIHYTKLYEAGEISTPAGFPFWVMMIGRREFWVV